MNQTASIGLRIRVGVSRVFFPPRETDGIRMRLVDDILPEHATARERAGWLERELASCGRQLYAAYYKDDKSARGLGQPAMVMILKDVDVTWAVAVDSLDIAYKDYEMDYNPTWWNVDTPPSRCGAH